MKKLIRFVKKNKILSIVLAIPIFILLSYLINFVIIAVVFLLIPIPIIVYGLLTRKKDVPKIQIKESELKKVKEGKEFEIESKKTPKESKKAKSKIIVTESKWKTKTPWARKNIIYNKDYIRLLYTCGSMDDIGKKIKCIVDKHVLPIYDLYLTGLNNKIYNQIHIDPYLRKHKKMVDDYVTAIIESLTITESKFKKYVKDKKDKNFITDGYNAYKKDYKEDIINNIKNWTNLPLKITNKLRL